MVCQIKCAWCGKYLGTKECAGNYMTLGMRKRGQPPVTHGICEGCKEQVLKKIRDKQGFNQETIGGKI